MNSRIVFFLFFIHSFSLFGNPNPGNSISYPWVLIDTTYSSVPCGIPSQNEIYPVFVNDTLAYYKILYPYCSPTHPGGYSIVRTFDGFLNSYYSIYKDQSGYVLKDFVIWNPSTSYIIEQAYFGSSISKTDDGGNTWHILTNVSTQLNSMSLVKLDTGFVISSSGVIYQFLNDTLVQFLNINFTSCINPEIYFTSANFGYILCSDTSVMYSFKCKILKSTDGGISWNVTFFDPTQNIIDLQFISDSVGYAYSYTASGISVLYTNDAGGNWSAINLPPPGYITSMQAIANKDLYVTQNSAIYRTLNNGNSWISLPSPCSSCVIRKIAMINDTVVYAYAQSTLAYNDNYIFRTNNGLGIEEFSNNSFVNIFPNPCQKTCRVQFQNESYSNLNIEIFDISGRLILRNEFEKSMQYVDLNTESFAAGILIMKIWNDKSVYTLKFIHEK